MFLDLAVCSGARYIVSGDDDLLRLKKYPGGEIGTRTVLPTLLDVQAQDAAPETPGLSLIFETA